MRVLLIIVLCSFLSCKIKPKTSETDVVAFDIKLSSHDIKGRPLETLKFEDDILLRMEDGNIIILDADINRRAAKEESLNTVLDVAEYAIVYKDRLIVRNTNKTYNVFDTSYTRLKEFESVLNTKPNMYANVKADTLWLFNDSLIFYVSDDIKLFESDRRAVIKRHILYVGDHLLEDTSYSIHSCCAGEWGGNVFFTNKESGRTKLYPAYCPSSVSKFQGDYILVNNLGHLGGSTSIQRFTNIEKLYDPELTANSKKYYKEDVFCCNCDTQNSIYSKLYGEEEYAADKRIGVYTVFKSWGEDIFSTKPFVYTDRLFSMQIGDTFFRIIEIKQDTIFEIQRPNFGNIQNRLSYIKTLTFKNRIISILIGERIKLIETKGKEITIYQ